MPAYCSLEEAFYVPEWIERDPEPCNYGSETQSDFVDRASGLPSNLMTDEQSQYLLYKQLQNKFSMVGVPQQQQQPQPQQEAFAIPHGMRDGVQAGVQTFQNMFAANDIDRLIIILLAGVILLSIIDYGMPGGR